MSVNVQDIADAIRDIVATNGNVLGAQLSAQLKARLPNWKPADYGARTLREFVANCVPGVTITSRSGMDVVYALEGSAPSSATAALSVPEVDFWRVWVSPNSPDALAVDRSGARVRAVPRGRSVESGQILLIPPPAEAHREVARSFLSTLPTDYQTHLLMLLNSGDELWWQNWVRVLRGTAHLAAWNAFRRQKFEEYLFSQLRAAGLDEREVDAVLNTIHERHVAARPRARRAPVHSPQQQDELGTLRRVVTEAVHRMSAAELRELKLPVGIVLDVLATSKPR